METLPYIVRRDPGWPALINMTASGDMRFLFGISGAVVLRHYVGQGLDDRAGAFPRPCLPHSGGSQSALPDRTLVGGLGQPDAAAVPSAAIGWTWSTLPDPVDFHAFINADLYVPNANVFRGGEDNPLMLTRAGAAGPAVTLETSARLEQVPGQYGGEMSAFDWTFSPRGDDGRPQAMFDRVSGKVDPVVVQYWHDHYDRLTPCHAHESYLCDDGGVDRGAASYFAEISSEALRLANTLTTVPA